MSESKWMSRLRTSRRSRRSRRRWGAEAAGFARILVMDQVREMDGLGSHQPAPSQELRGAFSQGARAGAGLKPTVNCARPDGRAR
jgi:hypothetical protein